MGWIKQNEDTNLPKWLTDNLKDTCDCGSPMENFYNPKGEVTARRCTNPKCPYVMGQKIKGMCDILKVKGIGEKTGTNLVTTYKLTNHFDAVPLLFKDKLTVTLYDLLRMMFVPGIDTGWSKVTDRYSTLDELYDNYNGEYKDVLLEIKDDLYYAASKFNLFVPGKNEFEALVTGTVMISGNIRGLTNRNSFIAGINASSKGLVELRVSESKRKTGIMALIQEADTPNRGKAACAIEAGIPIMTPQEFVAYISDLLQKALARKNGGKV